MGDPVTTFLDVGSHEGQTLQAVVGRFARICAFEPMPRQFEVLSERYSSVELYNYGLADFTGQRVMYGDNNAMEATLYSSKNDADESIVTIADFVAASAWFHDHIAEDEDVIMKLNCEGCEVAVMSDLLESGEDRKIRNVMIDFDVRKVVGMENQEGVLLTRMKAAGFDRFVLCEDVMHGHTHQNRILNWLGGLA